MVMSVENMFFMFLSSGFITGLQCERITSCHNAKVGSNNADHGGWLNKENNSQRNLQLIPKWHLIC